MVVKLKNFDLQIWNAKKCDIAKIASLAKFSQAPKLKKYLCSTENKILVQANPHNKSWRVGLSQNNELIYNPLNWIGKNLLGFILMDVRKILS